MIDKREALPTAAQSSLVVAGSPITPKSIVDELVNGRLSPNQAEEWIRILIAKDRLQRPKGQKPVACQI